MTDLAAGGLWLHRRNSRNDPYIRLLCFPHAGGGTAPFHRWASQVPPWIEVLPVSLPGREQRLRERPHTSIRALLKALVEEAGPRLTEMPVALFGQSVGALVAFELARLVRRRLGFSAAYLFVAACRAPQLPPRRPLLHALPDEQLVEQVRDRFGGFPAALADNRELMGLLLPALRADITMAECYRYTEEPPLDCPILALGGADDREVTCAELAAWRAQTRGGFSQQTVAGDHFFVRTAQSFVVRTICRRLDAVVQR